MNPTDPTPLPCPTPRTDAQAAKNLEQFPEGFTTFKPDAHVDADFARQLETELAQAQAKLADAAKELMQCAAQAGLTEVQRDEPCHVAIGRAFQRAQAEAAAMREALEEIEALPAWTSESAEQIKYHRIATESLESTTAGAELLERLRKAEALAKHFLPTTTENTKPQ